MERMISNLRRISLIMGLIGLILFTGCRNMPESYVYGGKVSGTAILVGSLDGDYSGVSANLTSAGVTGSVSTLSNGKFAFTDLPDGTYSVACYKSGYATSNQTGIINKSSEWDGVFYLNPNMPPDPPSVP